MKKFFLILIILVLSNACSNKQEFNTFEKDITYTCTIKNLYETIEFKMVLTPDLKTIKHQYESYTTEYESEELAKAIASSFLSDFPDDIAIVEGKKVSVTMDILKGVHTEVEEDMDIYDSFVTYFEAQGYICEVDW